MIIGIELETIQSVVHLRIGDLLSKFISQSAKTKKSNCLS